jgi:broad specificity polyphosphatase/5'/3'-nucleotidase SurE
MYVCQSNLSVLEELMSDTCRGRAALSQNIPACDGSRRYPMTCVSHIHRERGRQECSEEQQTGGKSYLQKFDVTKDK